MPEATDHGAASPEPSDAAAWARRFDLLGDPTRLRLLFYMHLHPGQGVSDLAEAAGITPTAASQSLRVLRDQGWVEALRDGRAMRYCLIDETAHRLLHLMGARHD